MFISKSLEFYLYVAMAMNTNWREEVVATAIKKGICIS